MEQFLDQYPALQVISYVITVLIGGVVYKYAQLWIQHTKDSEETLQYANQKLIDNLNQRILSITERVEKLEEEKEELHNREMERTKELANSKAEVIVLKDRVRQLEQDLEALRSIIKKYREKYGQLE